MNQTKLVILWLIIALLLMPVLYVLLPGLSTLAFSTDPLNERVSLLKTWVVLGGYFGVFFS
jgi:hypothetical protein